MRWVKPAGLSLPLLCVSIGPPGVGVTPGLGVGVGVGVGVTGVGLGAGVTPGSTPFTHLYPAGIFVRVAVAGTAGSKGGH